jgi:dTDP-4-amino-4,6-dideoxygalactose transaminase
MDDSPQLPPVAFSRPSLGRVEEEAVLEVMRSGWLTTGAVCARFEEEFARAVGKKHALALNSATAGLHLGLEAVGVGPGSIVLTSPYTFAATAEVVRYLGADPVFVDIDEASLGLSPAALEKVIEKSLKKGRRVSAIVPVHVAGRPCDMEAIGHLAVRHGIPVVEDAAHSCPAPLGGRIIGADGDAGVFSFYPTKAITTGEGGMVVTDNDEVARRIKVMRLHGIDRDVWNRYADAGASWRYDVVAPGYKYNLTDLAAAIGRVQLTRTGELLERRRRIVRRYIASFSGMDFLHVPEWSEMHAWTLFIVQVQEKRLSIGRDEFIDELQGRGIGASVHFIPLHTMSYYRERYGLAPEDFPVSMRCFQSAISLPLSASLTDDEVERVIQAVTEIGAEKRRR